VSAGDFIASLVSSLAWPAVIVVILVIFHRQFGTMLERLARVRIGAGGTEADLDWTQTESVVRQSLAAGRRPQVTSGTAGVAGTSPGGRPLGAPRPGAGDRAPQELVEDRWRALADQLRSVIRPSGSLGEDQLARADFDELMDTALRAGMLDAVTVRSLDGLRHLRNLARTSPGLTARQAQEFAVMADAVSYSMQREGGSVWPAA
jgi:hypothetical protein